MLCSASENAFSICNKYHFRVLAERGKRTPKLICYLVDHYDAVLISVIIGNNAVQLILSNIAAIFFLDIATTYNWVSGLDTTVSTIVVTFLTYIFGDTIPKILSNDIPNRLVYPLCYFNFFLYILFYPISFLFRGILFIIHKIFKIENKNILSKEEFIEEADKAVLSKDDLDNNEKSDDLFEKNEIRILKKAFNFDLIPVKNIMTKKEDIYALNFDGLNTSVINKALIEENYSRIPIYNNDLNHIIGILELRTYFDEYSKDKHLDIKNILLKPLFFDENKMIDEILEAFNISKTHMGFVINNKNEVVGLITMETILEQLVGDINEDNLDDKEIK